MRSQILSVREAAEVLGYKETYLRNMMLRREIPFYKPRNGRVYFKLSELEEWAFRNRREMVE